MAGADSVHSGKPYADAGRGADRAYQPALDGVRALAVAAVLAFHGGVAALPGGFLGVDAFFVLSGYLISSLLLAEHARTGRVALVAFWGRRARRLLPALLLLVAAVAGGSRWLLPPTEIAALRTDALAALGYVANWRMAYRGGDYFTATATASPLQHTWSLGIEEQFYLIWPLLLVLLAARRRLLFGLSLAGAAASTIAAAALFTPGAVDRVYYGTDSRAAALLVGAALATALARPAATTAPWTRPGPLRRMLGAAAAAGAVVTGWAWAHAHGSAGWLYHGGFLLVALAVVAVIAHAVLSPAGPTARLLALPPLVWLGRISYGVYLWHWPLFGWLTADRTGLTGVGLLGARCASTIAVATASYLVVERPIRAGLLTRGRPRLAPLAAAGALAATVLAVVVATVPPALPPVGPPAAAAAGTATGSSVGPGGSTAPGARSPLHRAGRTPGTAPRITFFGDSVSWSLGTYLPAQPGLAVTVRAVQGCGIARLPDIRYVGEPHPNYPGCDSWDARWRRGVDTDDPDVAVILLDRWELMDRRLGADYRHVGQPDFDAYLTRELDLAISVAGSRGAPVVLLTAPYTRRAERPDGGLWPEDEPARVDAWNGLLRAAAATRPAGQVTVLDLNRRACPDGRFTWDVDNVRLRSDGLHFTPEGVQRWLAPWLMPQLGRIAVNGPG